MGRSHCFRFHFHNNLPEQSPKKGVTGSLTFGVANGTSGASKEFVVTQGLTGGLDRLNKTNAPGQ